MLTRARLVSAMYLLSFSAVSWGQSCADLVSRATFGRGAAPMVSVSELQIPPAAWNHLEQARRAMTRNQAEVFDRESRRALALAPRFAQAHLLRAMQLLRLSRFAAARDAVTAARAIDPELPWSGVVLAGALSHMQQYQEALGVLSALHGEEAASWQASYERSNAELKLGHVPEALQWSEQAVEAAPVGCTQARLVRANALTHAGRRGEAITEMRAYLSEDRENARHPEVLLALKQAEEAESAVSPRTDADGPRPAASSGDALPGGGRAAAFQ